MSLLSRLIESFNSYYASKPVVTTMVTNAILGGIADTVAQQITMARSKTKTVICLEENIPELAQGQSASSFDYARLFRFLGFGLCMTPIQLEWFALLSCWFPLNSQWPAWSVLQRVICDQLVFAPMGLVAFFFFMTFLEGGGPQAIKDKFKHAYGPALRANYVVWPAAQLVNFRIMPMQFQVPFVATVGILWTAYLSLMNSKETHALEELDELDG